MKFLLVLVAAMITAQLMTGCNGAAAADDKHDKEQFLVGNKRNATSLKRATTAAKDAVREYQFICIGSCLFKHGLSRP